MIRNAATLLSVIIPLLAYFVNINIGFLISVSIIVILQYYVINIQAKTNLYKSLSESYEKFIIKHFKKKFKEEVR